jgi:hypothetical protein
MPYMAHRAKRCDICKRRIWPLAWYVDQGNFRGVHMRCLTWR